MRVRTLFASLTVATVVLGTGPAFAADPKVAPGGNFDLSVWQLQEPVGSPGSPTTISSSRLQGANGYQDAYFSTDTRDGAMTFWAPEKGVTTPNSDYARSELREMNRSGSAADWPLSGTHRMSATLRVVSVTSNVCVGQIHLGSGARPPSRCWSCTTAPVATSCSARRTRPRAARRRTPSAMCPSARRGRTPSASRAATPST